MLWKARPPASKMSLGRKMGSEQVLVLNRLAPKVGINECRPSQHRAKPLVSGHHQFVPPPACSACLDFLRLNLTPRKVNGCALVQAPDQVQQYSGEGSEGWEAWVRGQVTFNRVPEKV